VPRALSRIHPRVANSVRSFRPAAPGTLLAIA